MAVNRLKSSFKGASTSTPPASASTKSSIKGKGSFKGTTSAATSRSSFKGTPPASTSSSSRSESQSEFDPELMAEERKPPADLDLQYVSDDAQDQFADILARVEGSKDIVIQQELMSLLDHVTPINFLKK